MDANEPWAMYDNARNIANPNNKGLYANDTARMMPLEDIKTFYRMDLKLEETLVNKIVLTSIIFIWHGQKHQHLTCMEHKHPQDRTIK